MITIVALGNPGDDYVSTRHNVGWIVLSRLIAEGKFPSLTKSSAYNARVGEGVVCGNDVSVLFPLTFMNHSGVSVLKYIGTHGQSKDVIVVHDDIDLPCGDVRVSVNRGAGGHNGVQSIIDSLGTKDFSRVRIGIGKKNIFGVLKRPRGEALSKFVLGTFSSHEIKQMDEVSKKVFDALTCIIKDGIEKAMQKVLPEGKRG